ncbi:MAG: hypothetical protein AB7N71_05925 [Phycisphaerae bacterium]
MQRRFWTAIGTALLCSTVATAELPVQPGDIAFGLNTGTASLTAEQVRNAGLAGTWSQLGFLQSMEFDNAGGTLHANDGNLLALNFGTTGTGGSLAQLSTDGSNMATTLLAFDGTGGRPLSRVGGLSISPDNTRIAIWGYDTASVIVLNYNAGAAIGSGTGASATFAFQTAIPNAPTGQTHSTCWLDANTVMAYVANTGAAGSSHIYTVNVGTQAATLRATIPVNGTGSLFTDLDFNPAVSSLVFCTSSRFSGTSLNQLSVVNPATWTLIDSVSYNNSSDTFRECALHPDMRLYVSTFGSDVNALLLDANADMVVDATDIPLIADDSSLTVYTSTQFSSFNGMDIAFGTPAETGACCAMNMSCTELNETDCFNSGGEYRGDGTMCATMDICAPLTGACCIVGTGCLDATLEDDCTNMGGDYQGDNTVCGPNTCFLPPLPVLPGDVALGLSNQAEFETTAHIRDGNRISRWTVLPFLQSMEFDNYNGQLHNAQGNLIALNFGTSCVDPIDPTMGGTINVLSTDGTNMGEEIYRFNPMTGGVACTRINGAGVSTDNAYLSVTGFDDGNLYVLEYNEGPNPGTGLGATVGAVISEPTGFANMTMGTTWLDANTVMFVTPDPFGDPFAAALQVFDFDGANLTLLAQVPASFTSGISSTPATDVDYNPDVSPYIYCSVGSFSGGVTTNFVFVIDPTNPNPAMWTTIKVINLSTNLQTAREIALTPDGSLLISEFAQGGTPQLYIDELVLDMNGDGMVTLAETNALMNNSTVDYYSLNGGVGSSFNGLDVAHGQSGPVCGTCADSNCDGSVTVSDIGFFVTAVAQGVAAWNAAFPGGMAPCDYTCANDTNGDNNVTVGDIGFFVGAVTGMSCN